MVYKKDDMRRKNQDALDALLDQPIAFNPAFLRITGSPVAAIFLSQSWYWTKIHKNDDGWWYNSQIEIEEQTGLSRSNQLTARNILKENGTQEEKLKGVPATLHFRVIKPRVYELLGFQFAETLQTEFAESQQTSLQRVGKLVCGNPAIFNNESKITPMIILEKDIYMQKILLGIGSGLDHLPTRVRTQRAVEEVLSADDVTVAVIGNVITWQGLNGNSVEFTEKYRKTINNHLRAEGLKVEFLT